jgi:type II secretory pathway predicted ATPase ExeA
MTTGPYERYGLTSNPFRDLGSENLPDVELYHAPQPIDDSLRTIREEVLDKENRALVALVGGLGAGKTERLLLAATEGRQRGAFTIYFDVTDKTSRVLRGLGEEIQKASGIGGFAQIFGGPKWFRGIAALAKIKDQHYDPVKAGKALGLALNEKAPALLLLNDLHNLAQTTEFDNFVKVLQELADAIKPGVLVMFSVYPTYLTTVTRSRPGFASRINRTFAVPRLNDEAASLLLAKRLLGKRLVADLDPLYPFDPEAVALLNEAAEGNPRRLLKLADLAIEYGVERRSYRVDAQLVQSVLLTRRMLGEPPPVAGQTDTAPSEPEPVPSVAARIPAT